MTMNATKTDETWFPHELEDFLIQGWCSCPECDETFVNWDRFRKHAYRCVFEDEYPGATPD